MKKVNLISLLVTLTFASFVSADYQVIFESPKFFQDRGNPCVGDADNDGFNEIVFTAWRHVAIFSYNANSFALDSEWNLGDLVQAAYGIAIGDSNNDGLNEVLIGTWADGVFVYEYADGNYILEQHIDTDSYGNWSIEVADAGGSYGNEILVGERYGNFHGFRLGAIGYYEFYESPEIGTGESIRTVFILGIGDTNGNGEIEVVTYCDQGIIDIFYSPRNAFVNIWHSEFDNIAELKRQLKPGGIADINGDGIYEIFYADVYGNLFGVSYDGSGYTEFWNSSITCNPYTLAIGDLNRDGIPELIVGGKDGELYTVSLVDGRAAYLGNFGDLLTVALGDVTNDGNLELVVGGNDGRFRVITYESPLTLLNPNGGEKLIAGSNYDITWQTEVSVENVFIEYSTNDGRDWNDVNTVPNTGSYEWTVPQKNSSQCLVRVSDVNNSDVNDISNDTFRIYICTLSYDLNHDCNVNLLDFALLASEYLQPGIPVPETMVFIPGGEFLMGDHHDGMSNAPTHLVYVNSFYMSRYEITNQQYCNYLNSAFSEGLIEVRSGIVYAAPGGTEPYFDTNNSDGDSQVEYSGGVFSVRTKAGHDMSGYPVVEVSWYGAVAYADYYGGRLPTEAEWEYAALGGTYEPYYRFPWSNTITHSQANYISSDLYSYDVSPTRGHHPAYNDGIYPYIAPVGSFSPNGYGLYDMAGNVREWCNDWGGSGYYSISPYNNPQGPLSGTERILRGGGWDNKATYCRVANRYDNSPDGRRYDDGFRIVLDF